MRKEMVKQQQITKLQYNITFLIENKKKIKTNYFTENYVKLTITKTIIKVYCLFSSLKIKF